AREARRELLGRAQCRLHAVDVFDTGENGEALGRLPERVAPERLEIALLQSAPVLALDDAAKSRSLGLEERTLFGRPRRPQHEPLEAEGRGRRCGRGLRIVCIRVDERDVDTV